MNCDQAKALLVDSLSNCLAPEAQELLDGHLEECGDCRRELCALRSVVSHLDAIPAPVVEVDTGAIYQEAIAKERRKMRRWRRAAVLASGIAAVLVLFFSFGLELQWDANQFSLRWGHRPVVTSVKRVEMPFDRELSQDMQMLRELLHALSEDMQHQEAARHEEMASLVRRISALQQKTEQWQMTTARELAALYEACFSVKKGMVP